MTMVSSKKNLFFLGIKKGKRNLASIGIVAQTSLQAPSSLLLLHPYCVAFNLMFAKRLFQAGWSIDEDEKDIIAVSAPFIQKTVAFQKFYLGRFVYILLFKTIT